MRNLGRLRGLWKLRDFPRIFIGNRLYKVIDSQGGRYLFAILGWRFIIKGFWWLSESGANPSQPQSKSLSSNVPEQSQDTQLCISKHDSTTQETWTLTHSPIINTRSAEDHLQQSLTCAAPPHLLRGSPRAECRPEAATFSPLTRFMLKISKFCTTLRQN